jgi:hypothetical protein
LEISTFILVHRKFYALVQTFHKIVPLIPILSQFIPVNKLTTHFIKLQFDDISEAIQDSGGTV